jgi:hypothetical protein
LRNQNASIFLNLTFWRKTMPQADAIDATAAQVVAENEAHTQLEDAPEDAPVLEATEVNTEPTADETVASAGDDETNALA